MGNERSAFAGCLQHLIPYNRSRRDEADVLPDTIPTYHQAEPKGLPATCLIKHA
jgi:hypothetical protein